MRIQPPPDLEAALARQWAFVLKTTAAALESKGRASQEYGTAMSVAIAFATGVMCCYGFDSLSKAQKYLMGLVRSGK